MIEFNSVLAEKHGKTVGFRLYVATEKQFFYQSAKTRLLQAINTPDGNVVDAAATFEHARAKRSQRLRDVATLVTASVRLTVRDSKAKVIGEGLLLSTSIDRASLQVGEDADHSTRITYAQEVPVPEGLPQDYYGHQMIVSFEVNAMDERKTWIFH